MKKQGYKLYLLTNITEDSYNYINDLININTIFDGGIYSYQEHIIKPDKRIKYNLEGQKQYFLMIKKKMLFQQLIKELVVMYLNLSKT